MPNKEWMVVIVRFSVKGRMANIGSGTFGKNSDLMREKANSIAPDQTAGEASVPSVRFP
jgi:hypothetical protein